MCGPRKTIDDALAGFLDALRDLLDDRRLIVASPNKTASCLPPRRGRERLAVLPLRLEAEGLRRARALLRGRYLHGPPLRDAAPLLPRSADVEIGGTETDRSVAVRHGGGPNPAIAIRLASLSRRTIPSFPQPLCREPFPGEPRHERRNGPREFCRRRSAIERGHVRGSAIRETGPGEFHPQERRFGPALRGQRPRLRRPRPGERRSRIHGTDLVPEHGGP